MTVRGPLAITLLVALFLSLAVNLVIAGFAVARFSGARPGPSVERIVAVGIRAFPPEIRQEIAARSREQRGEFRTRIEAVQDARRRMFEAMRAEPFDRAALTAAFDNLRARTDEVQKAGQEIVAGVVAEAPAEVRSRIRPPRGPFP